MQLNPAEISELIKSRIEGLAASADIRNQGTVLSVTDGIVRVHGLSDAMAGEMLEFPPDRLAGGERVPQVPPHGRRQVDR
jgi:F-type H+-transporting ATPase subunit alpha